MEKFLIGTKKIIFHKQKDIFSSALILSLMSLVARVFGILRFRVLTNFFDEKQIELLLASFRIPDFIFEVLITGILGATFIPLFIKYAKDQDQLNNNISSIINLILLALMCFVGVMFAGAHIFIPLIVPGYSPAEIAQVVYLSRILLITQLPLLVMGYMLSGMAQANKIFVITSIAQVLYGLGSIVGTFAFSPTIGVLGPIVGVILGAVLFFAIQLPILFTVDFRYLPFVRHFKALREFTRLFIPRVLSVCMAQLDLTIDLALSSFLTRGSYAAFFFAQRLQFFPVSFFGLAYAQASLPFFSDLYRDKKFIELRKLFVDSLLQLIFLTMPVAFFFIFARTPTVRIFFGGPKFTFESTNLTALALSYFALSIPAHTIFYTLIRAFYATYDTKTPFFISAFSTIVNSVLSILAVFVFKKNVAFLAFAFSTAMNINVGLLLIFFYRKIGGFDVYRLVKHSIKITGCAFLAAVISYPLMKIWDLLILDTTRTINVFLLVVTTGGIYFLIYLFFAWIFTIEEVYVLGKLFITIKQIRKKIVEVYTDTV